AVMYLGRVVEQAPVDAIFHDPRHPYTRALLRSIPRMRSRSRARLTPIAGTVPHPYDRPPGRPFHPRCAEFIAGRCDRAAPVVELGRLRPAALRALRREMQMIFQDPFTSLNPRMTLLDLVGEPLLVHGMKRRRDREERVAELLRRVGLRPEYMRRFPHAFSG